MSARPAGLLATLLLGAAFSLIPTPGLSDDRGGFTVAMLRRDGVIIPFATFDGNRWTNRWPVQTSDMPIGLTDVPKDWWPGGQMQTNWTAWPTGGASRPITVHAPAVVKVHCGRRVGLRTDFMALEPPPPLDFQPYPKSGLAVTGSLDGAIEPIELVKPDTPDAKAFVESVKAKVTDVESRAVRAWSQSWHHPFGEKERAKAPITIEVLARTAGLEPGSQVYYFEAVKKYPGFFQVPDRLTAESGVGGWPQMCEYVTFAGGWVLPAPKGSSETKASVGAELSNCNREGLIYTLPLAAIRSGGRLFWIVQASSWDGERYDVIEIKAKEVRPALSVPGGSCR